MLERANEPSRLAAGLYWRARGLLHCSCLDEAKQHLSRASQIIEGLRAEISGRDSRARFLEERSAVQRLMVEVLMRQYRLTGDIQLSREALEISDSLRARGALDLLERPFRLRPGLDARELESVPDFDRPGQQADADRIDVLSPALDEILTRLDRDRQRALGPGLELDFTASPLDLDTVQRSLDDDTTVASLLLGEEESYLWILTAENLKTYPLPPAATLRRLADRFLETLFNSGEISNTLLAGRRLGRTLFGEDYERIFDAGGRRLLFVGEGNLQGLPLSVLPTPDATFEAPRYLVEEFEIVHLPSLIVFTKLKERLARPAAKRIAILA
ncbi:MAG: CHAT domain-containing protein, partial [Acidobacteriota bacterium]